MKEGVLAALSGVIVHPVQTLREITGEKPWVWGIVVYLVSSWVSFMASFLTGWRNLPEVFMPSELNLSAFLVGVVLSAPIFSLLGLLVISGIYHLIARLLRGEGSFVGLLSGLGFASFPTILTAPFALLGVVGGLFGSLVYNLAVFAVSIWVLVLNIIAIRENYAFSTGKAVLTFFIPVILFFVLVMLAILVAVVVAALALGGL